METKNCQNCKKDFTIDADDFSFYEKMKVPAPTWCSTCRMTRRLAFGNAWGVYFRNCEKCGKKTLGMYRPDSPIKVFCDPCWWADDWDGTEYGRDYDPTRPFLEQWKELRDATPHFSKDALYLTLKNCEYTNSIAFSKDCYMTFWADYSENVYHSGFINGVKDTMDVFRATKSELCYQSIGLNGCNKTYFSENCDDCVDVWFSRNCYSSTNCIGCVNLRGASYCIFNEKYSKEEYAKKIAELRLDTREGLENVEKAAKEFWNKLPYREYTGDTRNINVSGDYLYESKNAIDCYMCSGVEDSKYCQFVSVPKATNCMDYYGWGNTATQIYESAVSGEEIQSIKFSYGIFSTGMDIEYSGFCVGGKYNFGCANLKRKKYCILNKEYSPEEYKALKEKIIEDMKRNPHVDSKGRTYSYGEFFPPEFSTYPYLDSNASKFIEKSKEEAESEGYNWEDQIPNNYQKTIDGADLPQTLAETQDAATEHIIGCTLCGRCYRIPYGELLLYRKLNIPLASSCPKCREQKRFDSINKPALHDRTCANCQKAIKTAFPPAEDKNIYCVSCYQQAVS